MTLKKISLKEWKNLNLPDNNFTINFGPYFNSSSKQNILKKPKNEIKISKKVKKK